MMNRILAGCAAMVIMCGVAMAQQYGPPSSYDGMPAEQNNQAGTMEKFVGSVQKVDPAAMTLSVKDSEGTSKEFTLTSTTTVHKAKTVIPLSKVNPGDRVTISYIGTMENPVVQRVTVHSKKGSAGGATGGSTGSNPSVEPSTSTTDDSSLGGSTGGSTGPESSIESSTPTPSEMEGKSEREVETPIGTPGAL